MKQKKLYTTAPLPFVGQKRRFVGEFREAIKDCPAETIFVDLFGGSGLLSHIIKYDKPDARVVYNDYDNYCERIQHIDDTNQLLVDIRRLVGAAPKNVRLSRQTTDAVLEVVLKAEKRGYVDYITLSSAVMFSMKYVTSYEELLKETMYNNVRNTPYTADGYLDGLDIVRADYKEVFECYKNAPRVVFLIDPPYLSTEVGTYTMTWRLSDYLDVLTVLKDANYFYFTSNKSSIVELCEWIAKSNITTNPFVGAKRSERKVTLNYNSHYTDMMLYRLAG
ncbi:MAG: DNA adenine methylase [Muribaculaceae bacterium]